MKPVYVVILVVVIAAAAFWGGMTYEKSKAASLAAGGAGGRFAGRGFGVGLLLLLLVHVFAEIQDAADGRSRIGSHLDQVQAYFEGEIDGLRGIENPQLLAFGGDDADFFDLDPMIAPDVRKRVDVAALILSGSVAATGGGSKRIGHQKV